MTRRHERGEHGSPHARRVEPVGRSAGDGRASRGSGRLDTTTLAQRISHVCHRRSWYGRVVVRRADPDDRVEPRSWTFLSNHAHVLICLSRDPGMRLRDVADLVGITERTAQLIVADLEAEGYLTRQRVGRRNRYRLHLNRPLRHPLESHHRIGELIDILGDPPAGEPRAASGARSTDPRRSRVRT